MSKKDVLISAIRKSVARPNPFHSQRTSKSVPWVWTVMLLMLVLAPSQALGQSANVQAAYTGVDPAHQSLDAYLSIAGISAGKVENLNTGGAAAPFLPVLSDVTVNIGVAPGTSTTSLEVFETFSFSVANNSNNFIVLSGVIDETGFAANPDGKDIELDLFTKDNARLTGTSASHFQIAFFHGSTDSPAVDIKLRGGDIIFENIGYGEFDDYYDLPDGTFIFDVYVAGTDQVVASFLAENLFLGDAALVVLVGFQNPDANQNGDALLMGALFPEGVALPFLPVDGPSTGTSVEGPGGLTDAPVLVQNYPNPFTSQTTVGVEVSQAQHVRLRVFDILGREVEDLADHTLAPGKHTFTFAADHLPAGIYFYKLETDEVSINRKMMLVR